MTVVINGTTGVSGVAGSASTPALIGSDADSGYYINSANEPNASVNGTATWSAASTFGFKNRIINGAMMIDQRNAGASISVTSSETYPVDRFAVRCDATGLSATMQRSTVAPSGFTNSLLVNVTTGGSIGSTDRGFLRQFIEGFNVADFGFGTAGAATTTLSFWVRSSLTGTFSGALQNSAQDRSYVFTFSISAANTWEYKTITISGATTGTWVTDNGNGLRVWFDIGNGSSLRTSSTGSWQTGDFRGATGAVSLVANSGATFYIAGVQLEKGSTATSFDFRSYGTELALCQRYYQRFSSNASFLYISNWGSGVGATSIRTTLPLKTTMRAAPSSLDYANVAVDDNNSAYTATSVTTYGAGSVDTVAIVVSVASGLTTFRPYIATSTTSNGYIGVSSEL